MACLVKSCSLGHLIKSCSLSHLIKSCKLSRVYFQLALSAVPKITFDGVRYIKKAFSNTIDDIMIQKQV